MFQGKLFAIKTIFNGGIIAFFDLLMTYLSLQYNKEKSRKFQVSIIYGFVVFLFRLLLFGIKVRKIVPKIRFPLLFLFVSKIFMTK